MFPPIFAFILNVKKSLVQIYIDAKTIERHQKIIILYNSVYEVGKTSIHMLQNEEK